MFKLIVITSIFFAACSGDVSNDEALAQPHEECAMLIERVANIQRIREAARKDFEITMDDTREGSISKAAWHHEYYRFSSREVQLSKAVEQLSKEMASKDCI